MIDTKGLNPKQLAAVSCSWGPKLVIAGAGSGKTRVLTMRYAYLIDPLGLSSPEILAITFTNKAANEMKSRLKNMLGQLDYTWVGTFHSVCLKILRQDIHYLNRKNDFQIIDDEDQLTIFKEAYKMHHIEVKAIPYQQIFHLLGRFKSNGQSIAFLKDQSNWDFLHIKNSHDCALKINVIQHYATFCKLNNLVDFDDLLILANQLLTISEVRQKWQLKFKYILVDEFQDTNDQQYQLIQALAEQHQNLFVVGDPDQMIYSWRGASAMIINNFRYEFKQTELFILDINYRSVQEILDAANNLIAYNTHRIKKDLSSHTGHGAKPIYFKAESQDAESRWVVSKIIKQLSEGVLPEDIVILYRANYLSRNIEQALIANGLKYKIYGGIKFYQRREIKDLLAYLKAIYTSDELSLKRIINVPKRGIGLTTIDYLSQYAQRQQISFAQALNNVSDIEDISRSTANSITNFMQLLNDINPNQSLTNVYQEILDKTQYLEYLKEIEEFDKIINVEELKNSITQYEIENPKNTFSDYLQEVSLYTTLDENAKNAVSLMTIHVSKGLEFSYVFIIGLNEDIFPSKQSLGNAESVEEERRVAYVAITRAKQHLFLSSYGGINFMYNSPNLPSRFIEEISSRFYEKEVSSFVKVNPTKDEWFNSQTPQIKVAEQYTQNPTNLVYKMGDKIVHTVFGAGVILAVNNMELTVLFKPPYNKKIILSNHIAIKRLLN